jgi:hypothetical protein
MYESDFVSFTPQLILSKKHVISVILVRNKNLLF